MTKKLYLSGVPILFMLMGIAFIALTTKKAKGFFALFGKRFFDCEVYILTVRKKSSSDDYSRMLKGSDVMEESSDYRVEKSSNVIAYEYVVYDKINSCVYSGWIDFRFNIYTESEVCSIIRDITRMPLQHFKSSSKKDENTTYSFVDKFRNITMIMKKSPYYEIPSAKNIKVGKYV